MKPSQAAGMSRKVLRAFLHTHLSPQRQTPRRGPHPTGAPACAIGGWGGRLWPALGQARGLNHQEACLRQPPRHRAPGTGQNLPGSPPFQQAWAPLAAGTLPTLGPSTSRDPGPHRARRAGTACEHAGNSHSGGSPLERGTSRSPRFPDPPVACWASGAWMLLSGCLPGVHPEGAPAAPRSKFKAREPGQERGLGVGGRRGSALFPGPHRTASPAAGEAAGSETRASPAPARGGHGEWGAPTALHARAPQQKAVPPGSL